MAKFRTARLDGRSDRRVVYELVHEAPPDRLFDYDTISAALRVGLEGVRIGKSRIYAAIAAANERLVERHGRCLSVVRGIGYRILRTEEHLPAAMNLQQAAKQKIGRGIELLRHSDLDELTSTQRELHEAHFVGFGILAQAVDVSMRRHEKQEAAIEELKRRISAIEA